MAKKQVKLIKASDIISNPREILSVTPAFDFATGGIMLGSIAIFGGVQKGGKSLLCVETIARFLQEYPESEALYYDVENRLKGEQQLNHPRLDKARVNVLRSTSEHFLAAEEGLTEVETFCKNTQRSIIIIDSTSTLITSSELAEEVKGNYRSTNSKLLAAFSRRMAGIIPSNEHILIYVVHMIANLSGYGGPVLDSGNAIQFSSDLALVTRKKELWKEDDRTIGQKTFWNVTWSGIKAPGADFITYNRFNEGVDHAMEQCELGIEMGLIGQSGAWFELEFLKDKLDDPEVVKFVEASGKSEDKAFKCQGKAAVYSLLKENDHIGKLLEQELSKLF